MNGFDFDSSVIFEKFALRQITPELEEGMFNADIRVCGFMMKR